MHIGIRLNSLSLSPHTSCVRWLVSSIHHTEWWNVETTTCKVQSLHNASITYIDCKYTNSNAHVHFSFLFLLGFFSLYSFFWPCAMHSKIWYECMELAKDGARCVFVYSCIYKDVIDPYFLPSVFFFDSLVRPFARWLLHPNNGVTWNFQPVFFNSMFSFCFCVYVCRYSKIFNFSCCFPCLTSVSRYTSLCSIIINFNRRIRTQNKNTNTIGE